MSEEVPSYLTMHRNGWSGKSLMPEESTRLRNEVVAGEQARELLVYDRMVAAMLDAAHKAWNAGYTAGRKSVK